MSDNVNPYHAPANEVVMPRPTRRRQVGWFAHAWGVLACIWGLAAWIEWFVVPLLIAERGGPVPYLAFAPQATLLFLGCIVLSAIALLQAMLDVKLMRVLYALPATAYVVFQVWRIL